MTTSVGEDMPRQMARVRMIQRNARELGVEGFFLVTLAEGSLIEAEQAIASGDLARIIAAYEDLKGYKE